MSIPTNAAYTPIPTRAVGQADPPADVNKLDDAFEATTTKLNEVIAALGGMVWDGTAYAQGRIFIGPTDPATLATPPTGHYAWINTGSA